MSNAQQIEQVEVTLEHAKEAVALGNSIKKLYTNREFKKVFVERLFKEEPARLTALLGEPNLQEDDERKLVIKALDSIGVIQAQLRAWLQQAEMMERAIEENNELLDDLRAEEAEEAEED